MATASTFTFLRADEVKVLAARSLRLCPSCIHEGFHSPFHQLLFIERCPIHHCPLTTRCSDCGNPTAPYALTRQSFQIAYGCGSCGQRWLGTPAAGSVSVTGEQKVDLLRGIGDWLVKRKEDRTIEAEIVKLVRFMEGDQDFDVSVRQLSHRWADILACFRRVTVSRDRGAVSCMFRCKQ